MGSVTDCPTEILIPLDYGERHPEMLSEIADIFSVRKKDWAWGVRRHLYGVEYTWALNQLLRLMTPTDSLKVLDAGGGAGAVQYYLGFRDIEVVNVSRGHGPLVGKTRTGRTLPIIEYIQADLADTGLEENSLDGVISVSSIEHNEWPHIIRILDHLVGLLKPGSPMVVTVPAAREKGWYPAGKYPEGPNFPDIYLFDSRTFDSLEKYLKPKGEWLTKGMIFPEYQKLWDKMKNEMDSFPRGHRRPYLSAGFVFIKKG